MKERIVRYTSEEMDELAKYSLSDWDAVKKMTDDDIDFDDFPEATDEELASARHIDFEKRYQDTMKQKTIGRPKKKERLKRVEILLDSKSVDWLKKTGRGWSTRLRKTIQDLISKNLL